MPRTAEQARQIAGSVRTVIIAHIAMKAEEPVEYALRERSSTCRIESITLKQRGSAAGKQLATSPSPLRFRRVHGRNDRERLLDNAFKQGVKLAVCQVTEVQVIDPGIACHHQAQEVTPVGWPLYPFGSVPALLVNPAFAPTSRTISSKENASNNSSSVACR